MDLIQPRSLGPVGNIIRDATNMMDGAGGLLASFEVPRPRNLLQYSQRFEFAFIEPKRLDLDDHTEQYPSYRMLE